MTDNVDFQTGSGNSSPLSQSVILHVQDASLKHAGVHVLKKVSFQVAEAEQLFVLGARKAGKSALIQMISGEIDFDEGSVARKGRVSYPLGQLPIPLSECSIVDYIRKVTKLYGGDPDEIMSFFSALGFPDVSGTAIGGINVQDRRILSIALGLAIPFDLYLWDDFPSNMIGVDALVYMLRERMRTKSFIFTSRMAHGVRDWASRVAIIADGSLTDYRDWRDGLRAFREAAANVAR